MCLIFKNHPSALCTSVLHCIVKNTAQTYVMLHRPSMNSSDFLFFLPEAMSTKPNAPAGNIFRGKEMKSTAMKVFLCQSTPVNLQIPRDSSAEPPCIVPFFFFFWFTDADMCTSLSEKREWLLEQTTVSPLQTNKTQLFR